MPAAEVDVLLSTTLRADQPALPASLGRRSRLHEGGPALQISYLTCSATSRPWIIRLRCRRALASASIAA